MTLRHWLSTLREPPRRPRSLWADEVRSHSRALIGKYARLYEYLEQRHADSVVLRFAEIEDLIGSSLPERARRERQWWIADSATVAPHADAWILANRTAVPNLVAQTVVFDRALCN